MPDLIAELLIIQDLDHRLAALEREQRDIPARQEAIASRLEHHKQALAQREETAKKEQAHIRELEGEVDALKEKIARLRKQQYEIKSNVEYATLEGEIGNAQKGIAAVEDRELAAMERHAELLDEVEESRRAWEQERTAVDQDIAAMQERAHALEEEIAVLRDKRQAAAQTTDPVWLARYERILDHVVKHALAPVEHGACGGCHMQLPPQVVNDAAKPDRLPACDFCGRLLYRR